MNYAYLRVSTSQQDLEHQRTAALDYANKNSLPKIEFIEEKISSRKNDRAIYDLIDRCQAGDNLIVFELSRLARSMKELESIRVKLSDTGVDIHAISQNLVISSDKNDIATRALVFALELSAEIERNMISERTKNALAVKKSQGAKLGRPRKSQLDSRREDIMKYKKLGLNITAISKLLGVHRNTLDNWLKLHGSELIT